MLKGISIKSIGRVILGILMVIVIAIIINNYTLKKNVKVVAQAWKTFNAERSTKFRMVRELNAVLGYDGMIHHLKDYLIRREIVDFKKSKQDIASARFIIRRYHSLATAQEIEPLKLIGEMLSNYEQALNRMAQFNQQGVAMQDIDARTRVDDHAAIKGLLFLQHVSSRSGTEGVEDVLSGSKIRLINWLRGELGYNGLIHNLKNFIVRRDEKYREATELNIASLYSALDYYQALDTSTAERAALNDLKQDIARYESDLAQVSLLVRQGMDPAEIDRKLTVQQQSIIHALNQLSRSAHNQNEQKAHQVSEQIKAMQSILAAGLWVYLLPLLILLIFIIWLIRSRIIKPVSEVTLMMQKLADNPFDSVVDVDSGDNEIGKMFAALKVFKNNSIQMLQEAELIRLILGSVQEGIYGVDTEGKVTFINSAASRMLGWQENELQGKAIHDLCHHSYSDGSHYPVTECPTSLAIRESRNVHIYDEAFWRKDGTSFPVEFSTVPIIESHQVVGAVVVFRDISERKRIERMKSEFISTVSHELRTPLTSIRGSLGLINGGAVGELPAEAGKLLKIASNNTERLLLLINDILDVEKIESGEMNFSFHSRKLMPMIDCSVEDNASFAKQHSVSFKVTQREDDVSIYCDEGRFLQVMANLLSNAAKFSAKNSTVEILVEKKYNTVRISVKDSGPGIPKEFQSRIFDRFTQSDSTDSRKKSGTGLGLNITRAIVEKHDGQIGFVSCKQGATFYIDLPAIEVQQSVQPAKGKKSSSSLILVIEDDLDVATLLTAMLDEEGYDCHVADNAEQAWQLLKDNPGQYSAITLDLILPGKGGIALIDELRKNHLTSAIPIIVVSAKADESKRLLRGGAVCISDWLNKPIEQDRLLSAVKLAVTGGQKPRILHVEDDEDIHQLVKAMLSDCCQLSWKSTLRDSKLALQKENYDLVLLDIKLPDGSGLELLSMIEEYVKPPRVVIFSAYDVSGEFAARVNAVMMKSKTTNKHLLDTVAQVAGLPIF